MAQDAPPLPSAGKIVVSATNGTYRTSLILGIPVSDIGSKFHTNSIKTLIISIDKEVNFNRIYRYVDEKLVK